MRRLKNIWGTCVNLFSSRIVQLTDFAAAMAPKGYTPRHFLLAAKRFKQLKLLMPIPSEVDVHEISKGLNAGEPKIISNMRYIVLGAYEIAQVLEKEFVELTEFNEGAIPRATFDMGDDVVFAWAGFGLDADPDPRGHTFNAVYKLIFKDENTKHLIADESVIYVYLPSLPGPIVQDCLNSSFSLSQVSNVHCSYQLQMAIFASSKFWSCGSVDPSSSESFPSRDRVIDWLKEQGLNESPAKDVERMIRPGFAGGVKGRSMYSTLVHPAMGFLIGGDEPLKKEVARNKEKSIQKDLEKWEKMYQEIRDGVITMDEAEKYYNLTLNEVKEIVYEFENFTNPYGVDSGGNGNT